MIRLRRTWAAALLTASTGMALLVVAPAAQAAPTSLTLDCDTLIPGGSTWSDVGFSTSMTVTAPASAPTGAPITFSATIADAPRSLPLALDAARVTTSAYSFSIDAAGRPPIGATAASDSGQPGPQGNLTPSETLSVPPVGDVTFEPVAPYEPGDSLKIKFVNATYTLQFEDVGGTATTATIVCRPRTGTPDPTTGAFNYDPVQVEQIALFGEPIANPIDNCTAPCSTQQNVFAEVVPGALTQQVLQAPGNPSTSQVDLGAVTTATAAQDVSGPMNPIQVTDARGGTYGWTLTADLDGPFVTGAGGHDSSIGAAHGCLKLHSDRGLGDGHRGDSRSARRSPPHHRVGRRGSGGRVWLWGWAVRLCGPTHFDRPVVPTGREITRRR